MKRFFRAIHLYLGLVVGLVVMMSCLTGCILVFEDDLQELFHRDRYFIPLGSSKVSLERLIQVVHEHVPNAQIRTIKCYRDPKRTVEINYTQSEQFLDVAGEKKKEVKIAFIDPYTSRVVGWYRYSSTFFYQVLALHRWLLGGKIGKLVVGLSTLLFLFVLITGLVLWFPKSRAMFKQRIRVKLDGNRKRLFHDLHVVLGFYVAIFLFICAFTGLNWSFKWFNKGLSGIIRSEIAKPEVLAATSVSKGPRLGIDSIFAYVQAKEPNVYAYGLSLPSDSGLTYAVQIFASNNWSPMLNRLYSIDPYSGQIVRLLYFKDLTLGQQIKALYKPVHTASIFGIYSKVLGFLVCCLGVSFPITGLILWRSRLSKGIRKPRVSSPKK